MRLINLLSWLPGHSGFGSYVTRVLPGLDGLRLQLGPDGNAKILDAIQWQSQPPSWAPSRRMRFLQRYSLVQHGLDLPRVLRSHNYQPEKLEAIYSPFFDALLCWPEVPQLITCHDLTPLLSSNSRKAWLRYKYWQPVHCRVAARFIAISRYVADQLIAFGVDSELIEVIPNGISISRPPILEPKSSDLLVLARHDLNKNLIALMRGVSFLQLHAPGWQGVVRIIGRHGRQSSLVRKLRRQLPRPEQVQLIDAVSQEQLVIFLRSSLALISASSEEGFDYPILEAKAEGLPTLISDIPVHREFHSDSSLFFPVDDPGQALGLHVIELLSDFRLWKHLSATGLDLARSLSVKAQVQHIDNQFNALIGC